MGALPQNKVEQIIGTVLNAILEKYARDSLIVDGIEMFVEGEVLKVDVSIFDNETRQTTNKVVEIRQGQ